MVSHLPSRRQIDRCIAALANEYREEYFYITSKECGHAYGYLIPINMFMVTALLSKILHQTKSVSSVMERE